MWLPPDLFALCRSILDGNMPGYFEDERKPSASRLLAPDAAPEELSQDAFPLLSLPLDILAMHLPEHLPYTAILALRFSSRDLHAAIPVPKKKALDRLSECERKAVLATTEESDEGNARRCCIICGSWYPLALFEWVPRREIERQDCKGAGKDTTYATGRRRDMDNRVCRWHYARFQRIITIQTPTKDSIPQERWTLEEACMHCGGVLGWGRCQCQDPCQTCWKRTVWSCTRTVDQLATKTGNREKIPT